MTIPRWCWALALIFQMQPALACSEGDVALFACITENEARSIAVCGQPDGNGGWLGAYYEYTTEKGVQFTYPKDPAQSRRKLFFSHYFKDGLYRMHLRFESGGFTYRIYYEDAPASTEENTVNGPDAGIEVLKKSKTVATISCGERPANYSDDIRKVSACDLMNPYGKRACAAEVPEVK
jgi:hypothetical protein